MVHARRASLSDGEGRRAEASAGTRWSVWVVGSCWPDAVEVHAPAIELVAEGAIV